MLSTFRDDHEQLMAACAWNLVNAQGQLDDAGTFVWIEQIEVSQGFDCRQQFRNIIADILWRAPHATVGYWVRRDSTGTHQHRYTREHFTNYLHRGMGVMV